MDLTYEAYVQLRKDWDEMMRQYRPGRDNCIELVLDLSDFLMKGPRSELMVLDVCCGMSAAFTEKSLLRFPEAKHIAIDISRKNLHIAQTIGNADKVEWVQQNCTEDIWTATLQEGAFDLVFIGWASHEIEPWHLPKLYKNLARLLREGGLLFNVDFMRNLRPAYMDMALNHTRARVSTDFQELHSRANDDPKIQELQQQDLRKRTSWNVRHTKEVHLEMISGADFKDADEVWRYLGYSLIMAIR